MNLSSVKPQLERMSCSEHKEHPTISIKGDSLSISCCCEKFKTKIGQRAEELVAEQAKEEIEKSLGRFF